MSKLLRVFLRVLFFLVLIIVALFLMVLLAKNNSEIDFPSKFFAVVLSISFAYIFLRNNNWFIKILVPLILSVGLYFLLFWGSFLLFCMTASSPCIDFQMIG